MAMTGTILAGGENRRIPLLKGHIEINEKKIIDSSVNLMRNLFGRVVISTNSPELYFYCGVPMIGDVINQRGPLTGIFSVLSNIKDDAIFVVACDMPFLSEKLIRYMVERFNTELITQNTIPPTHPSPAMGEGKGGGERLDSGLWTLDSEQRYDAVIPIFEEKPQPLFGIYSKNILGIIEKRLKKGLKKLKDMLTELKVLYIKEEEVRQIDPEGRSFLNINTMEDYKKIVNSA
ncbi:MAG: molybdenum cofactor guanylyltransferase [Thermodesulfovibrionales bacterium]|nr:molybdenum cofactor guanylyltransferase [Thermodesulfovibrionales bacterium]